MLALIVTLTTGIAAAAPPACVDELISPAVVDLRLAEFDHVRPLVKRLLADPAVPLTHRRLIANLLADQSFSLIRLDEALRERLRFRDDAMYSRAFRHMGFYHRSFDRDVWAKLSRWAARLALIDPSSRYPATAMVNRAKEWDLSSIDDRAPYVLLPDQAPTPDSNQLLGLVHEAAHARFDQFLRRNLDLLLKRWPRALIRRGRDGVTIENDLFYYLTERFAIETEYVVNLKTDHYHPEAPYARFASIDGNAITRDLYRRVIAFWVVQIYGITHPRVVDLNRFTLSEILRGVPFRGR